MTELDILRSLVDFGLLVLIWLVQLVIYPPYAYMSREKLIAWHEVYTRRITFVVAPLMFAQVGIVATELVEGARPLLWLAAVLVLGCWLATFFHAVPLHARIGAGRDLESDIPRLVRGNWIRTVLWTAIFGLGFFD